MKVTLALAAAAGLIVTTLALSAQQPDDTPGHDAPRVTSSPRDHEADALTVTIGETGTSCMTKDATLDLAWFDTTWHTEADLESFSFDLLNPVGITQVGAPVTVPPINFGGRIDYGGFASWNSHDQALAESSAVSWAQRGDTAAWAPIEDQSGMLVFHLRLDPQALATETGASLDGVVATYLDAEGAEHQVTAEAENHFTFDGSQCD